MKRLPVTRDTLAPTHIEEILAHAIEHGMSDLMNSARIARSPRGADLAAWAQYDQARLECVDFWNRSAAAE